MAGVPTVGPAVLERVIGSVAAVPTQPDAFTPLTLRVYPLAVVPNTTVLVVVVVDAEVTELPAPEIDQLYEEIPLSPEIL